MIQDILVRRTISKKENGYSCKQIWNHHTIKII